MLVYVLLYNANTNDEGIYTIQEGDRQKILMFQQKDDAERFAMQLEAQDFPAPTAEAIDSEEIKLFCDKAGYDWQIVEPEQLVVPPETNLEATDWEKEAANSQNLDSEPAEDAAMSNSELDKIRNQLEGLL